ncbi:MAG: hypothetical protein WBW71_13800 [Bacteroidota bacterium]
MSGFSSRRRFLKETLFGAIALSAAKCIPFDSVQAEVASEIQQQLKFFSPIEFLIMQAAAGRIVGTSAGGYAGTDDVNVALKADTFLADADPEIQDQFHQLLTVFNGALFAFFFDFRFSSFVEMSPVDQDSYLQSWMTSTLSFRRSAFQALKRVSLSLFYTDSRSWNEIHYDGMFLPWERGE